MSLYASMTAAPGALLGKGWLASFHQGERDVLEAFYRDYYATADRAVGAVLCGADRETVVQELFLRIVQNPEIRRGLRGGSAAAWVSTVAKNQAIDYRRKHRREVLDGRMPTQPSPSETDLDELTDGRRLLERFRSEVLPPQWSAVFDVCFVEQQTQREAARRLGLSRTTLLYQVHRIRALLRHFVLETDA